MTKTSQDNHYQDITDRLFFTNAVAAVLNNLILICFPAVITLIVC